MLTTGELYIDTVDAKDMMKSFRCEVKHRLTNEKILSSNAARVFVRGLRSFFFTCFRC